MESGDVAEAERSFNRALLVETAVQSTTGRYATGKHKNKTVTQVGSDKLPLGSTVYLSLQVLHGDACRKQGKFDEAEQSYLAAMKSTVKATPTEDGVPPATVLEPARRLAMLYAEKLSHQQQAEDILRWYVEGEGKVSEWRAGAGSTDFVEWRRIGLASHWYGEVAEETLACIEDYAGGGDDSNREKDVAD